MFRYFLSVLALVPFFPLVGLAQGDADNFGGLNDFFENATAFLGSTILPFLFALALAAFVYGIFKYFIWGGANDDDRESGKSLMIWGIIGLVLIVAVWGIVNLVIGILDTSTGEETFDTNVTIPPIPS
jgi:uncharacterized membrane protein YidH (DUF202 family)